VSDIKWFSSYDEMAVALGISKDSARRLVLSGLAPAHIA
jgi:hypothetical protein